MKPFDYENYLNNNPLLKEEDVREYGMQDNEFQHMDNYDIINVLLKIQNLYAAEQENDPAFAEVVNHLGMAIRSIKRRTGN